MLRDSDLPIEWSPELLTQIGRLIVSWSIAENELSIVTYELAIGKAIEDGDDLTPYVIVNGVSGKTLIALTYALCGLRFGSDLGTRDELWKQLDRLKALADVRDSVAHWRWKRNKSGHPMVHRLQTTNKVRAKERMMTSDELARRSDEIRDCVIGIQKILKDNGYSKLNDKWQIELDSASP